MANSFHKIVTYVPKTHAKVVREAIGKAGAGKIGNYSFCSFSSQGIGRFLPGKGASPAIGKVGKLEEVPEERIEVTCASHLVGDVIKAIKTAHPYEEPVIDHWPINIAN
ncbi:MAG TPA: hypothetical protein VJH69_00335 [Candidatus Paceibacterota bacterium]